MVSSIWAKLQILIDQKVLLSMSNPCYPDSLCDLKELNKFSRIVFTSHQELKDQIDWHNNGIPCY